MKKNRNELLNYIAAVAIMFLQPSVYAQTAPSLDPLGCTNLTDAQLNNAGYETVRDHGAVGDGITNDTAAIQAAINAGLENRRMVYFHPGDYLIRDTLQVRQEPYQANGNDDPQRFGITLLGSYCGTEKPTIRFPRLTGDAHAQQTNESEIAINPKPVLLLMRDSGPPSNPSNRPVTLGREPSEDDDIADDSDSSRDWNQVVRNLRIVTGPNPGVVGIRHLGAEGSSAQEVTIDATGGYAGFYHVNSSGGYTYNAEVIGGKYGLFIPFGRGGATVISGLKLSDQEHTPIIVHHYAPTTLIGADIKHNDGRIVGGINGTFLNNGNDEFRSINTSLRGSQRSGGHLTLVDGQIEITGDGAEPIFENTPSGNFGVIGDRSVYMKNMYFKTPNPRTVLENGPAGGRLSMAGGNNWFHVTEYSASGSFDENSSAGTKLIHGVATENTYYDDPQ